MKRIVLLLTLAVCMTTVIAQTYKMVVRVNNGTAMGFPDGKITIPVDNITDIAFEEITDHLQTEATPISFLFKEYYENVTRSPMKRSPAMEVRKFGVFGSYNDGEPLNQDGVSANLMNNQKVTFLDGRWEYYPIKYWPQKVQGNNYASFFAYSPYADGGSNSFVSVNSESDKPVIEYKSINPMDDAGELVYGSRINTTEDVDNGCVTIETKYPLVQLNLNVGLTEDVGENTWGENTKVTIKSVTIGGQIPYSGQFDLYREQWINRSEKSLSYTIEGNNLSAELRDAGETAAANQPIGVTHDKKPIGVSPILLIPTDGQKEITITFDYFITTDDSFLATGYSRIHNVISKTFNVSLNSGTRYDVCVNLGLTSMSNISISASSWNNTHDSVINY